MDAAFLTTPETLEIREIPDPAVPAGGLVLQVKACGICGSDLRRWREGPPPGADGVIPGHEAAGVVVAVDERCSRFQVGDRLAIAPDVHCGKCYYCRRERYNLCDNLRFIGITPGYPGGFAEKMALTSEIFEKGIVHEMPEGLSFAHAAVSEPSCSVLATHDKAGTQTGEVVVVIGAGPTGCLHIAVAKSRGAKVVVIQRSKIRQELAKRFDPDLVIDATGDDVVARVKEFTEGLGADIVICANPVAETQRQAVEMVRKGGKVLLFGGLPKANPMTTMDGNKIHYGEVEVVGAFSYHPRVHREALDLLADGTLPAEKIITHRFPLDDINQAYRTAAAGDALKVLIAFERD
jgi:L-iditol 2-dehydrogenase